MKKTILRSNPSVDFGVFHQSHINWWLCRDSGTQKDSNSASTFQIHAGLESDKTHNTQNTNRTPGIMKDHLCYQIKDISLVNEKIGEVNEGINSSKFHRSFTTQVGKARVAGKAQMGMHRALVNSLGWNRGIKEASSAYQDLQNDSIWHPSMCVNFIY